MSYQQDWDNSGLQVGERDADIRAALLTVDLTEAVVEEAIARGCNLIISHHPLLFHGLKQVVGANREQRCVAMALQHHIAIYSSHTCMDAYLNGVSGEMAKRIGLIDYHILVPAKEATYGLGVIGLLPSAMAFADLLGVVERAFGAPWLRYVMPEKEMVQTIALCGGAGADLVGDAIAQKADVFISADFKYHDFQDAKGRIGVIDMDHWVSEQVVRDVFGRLLEGMVEVHISRVDRSPVQMIRNQVNE